MRARLLLWGFGLTMSCGSVTAIHTPSDAAMPTDFASSDRAVADQSIRLDGSTGIDAATAPIDAAMPIDVAMGDGAMPTSCAAASASSPHFVDPSKGVDDLMHGGGPGSCAWKSLVFALKNATGDITLAAVQSTYLNNITLNGTQHLFCNHAVIESSNSPTVTLAGTQNELHDCNVDGVNANGNTAIDIQQVASGSPHHLYDVGTSNCAIAVHIEKSAGNVLIEQSAFNSEVLWEGGNGTLTSNAFSSIVCSMNGSASLTGSANFGYSGGNVACPTCANCPFK